MKYTVKGNVWVWVRKYPDGTSEIIGKILNGNVVDATPYNASWSAVSIAGGGAPMGDATQSETAPLKGYIKSALLIPVISPPPQQGVIQIGVNVITHAPSALDAAAKGCRAFLIVDNEVVCRQIKQAHPDAIVVARRWTADWKLNGAQLADKIGGANDGVIYELLNEADNWPYGTVEQIKQRIDIELDACARLRAKGVKVCLGGYSMGTAAWEKPEIAEQGKRYAALYNSDPGVYFSYHGYSPNMNHTPDIWYERRYEMLFTKCGFNPAVRKIILTEDGVDEGGVGGYPAHKATTADFERVTQVQQTAHAQLVMGYPSPLIARMLFAYTQNTNQRWAGFEISSWIGSLQARGWK